MHGTLDLFTWTTERVDQLRLLIGARYSSSEIAREFKITRNAVIGKANRLGISFNSSSPHSFKVRQERKAKGLYVEPVRKIKFSRPGKSKQLPPVDTGPLPPLNLTFEQIGKNSCRYIVTDDSPFLFCGHPKHDGSSYCSHHKLVTSYGPENSSLKKVAETAPAHHGE